MPAGTFKKGLSYRFRVKFEIPNPEIEPQWLPTALFEFHQTVRKIKINYARSTIKIWADIPITGSMFDVMNWFSSNKTDIIVEDLNGLENNRMQARFNQSKLIDNQIVYDYGCNHKNTNYMEWQW